MDCWYGTESPGRKGIKDQRVFLELHAAKIESLEKHDTITARSNMKISPRLSKASAILSLVITVVVFCAWTYHVFRHPPTNKIGYLFTVPFFAAGILNLYFDWRNIRQPKDLYIPAESIFVVAMILTLGSNFDSRYFMICSGLLTFLIILILIANRFLRRIGIRPGVKATPARIIP